MHLIYKSKCLNIIESFYIKNILLFQFTSSQQFFTNVEIPPVAIDTCHESILPDAPCLVVHRDMVKKQSLSIDKILTSM